MSPAWIGATNVKPVFCSAIIPAIRIIIRIISRPTGSTCDADYQTSSTLYEAAGNRQPYRHNTRRY